MKMYNSANFSTIICCMCTDLRNHPHIRYLFSDLTFSPGQWPYQAAKHCECCAATPDAAPFGPRKTIGTFTYTTKICLSHNVIINYSECNYEGVLIKSLARPTSRCRRMELIVSLERGVCSCAELQVFSCYRGWKEACKAMHAISTTWRCELSSSFFFSCKARRGRKFMPFWKKH